MCKCLIFQKFILNSLKSFFFFFSFFIQIFLEIFWIILAKIVSQEYKSNSWYVMVLSLRKLVIEHFVFSLLWFYYIQWLCNYCLLFQEIIPSEYLLWEKSIFRHFKVKNYLNMIVTPVIPCFHYDTDTCSVWYSRW